MKLRKVLLGSLLSLSLVTLLTACAPEKKGATSNANDAKTEKLVKMKIGAMPAPDSAPFYVAQEKGFFKKQGIDVDVQLFHSGLKRDAAVSAGQIDGAVTDIGMFTSYIKGKTGFKLGTSLTGRFGVISKNPEIKDWKDLTDKKFVNYPTAITNYYLAVNLKKRNLPNNTTMIRIPDMQTKLQAIENGKVDVTIEPEPLLTMAKLQGFDIWGESNPDEFRLTALALSKKFYSDKKLMGKFYKAYNQAVDLLNKDPQVVKDVISKDLGMSEEVAEKAKFPKFKHAESVDINAFKGILDFYKDQKFFTDKIVPEDYILEVKANK